ncbi:MAG: GPW/gp25 family protein [Dyadobacter sp.]|uniref:GPW/gp25 family protein n=1 Tax=Dyadobacter sp. TaxID=1914288 RepID=UPI0032666D3D
MTDDFYPVPPSFGALMKRQGTERNFVEIARLLGSYDELIKRFGDGKKLEDYQIIKKLMNARKCLTFQELRQQMMFSEVVDYLVEETVIQKINVKESIHQNISLYLATRPKEYYFDSNYGCIVHHFDFRQLNDTPSKDQLKRSVSDYLQKFETRIAVNNVNVDINDVQEVMEGGTPRICRYITINIGSTLVQTQERLPDMKFRLVRYS